MRAFLPFTTLTIPDGYVDFVEGKSMGSANRYPRDGASRLTTMSSSMPLGLSTTPRLILRSDPSLPQGSLIQLTDHRHGAGCVCASAAGRSDPTDGLVAPEAFHAQALVRWQRG